MQDITILAKFPPSTKKAILKAIIADYNNSQLEDIEDIAEDIVSILVEDLEGNIGLLETLAELNK